MPGSAVQWRRAFARQAASDLQHFQAICRVAGLPPCHRLHAIQMCCEKLVKAWQWRQHEASGQPEPGLTHNVVAKTLPTILREHFRTIKPDAHFDRRSAKHLCREIDLLHPQIDDDGRRLDNCEYPFSRLVGSRIEVISPSEHRFPVVPLLEGKFGREFLKAVSAVCSELIGA